MREPFVLRYVSIKRNILKFKYEIKLQRQSEKAAGIKDKKQIT